MVKHKNKKKSKKKSKSSNRKFKFIILMIIILLIYFFVQGDQGFLKYLELRQEKKKLLQQLNELKKENDDLQNEIELLTKNYRYIEKKAREMHYMGKDGEKIYIMNSPDK